MRVVFRTNHLRRCNEDVSTAARSWGAVTGQLYQRRVQTMMDAASFEDLFTLALAGFTRSGATERVAMMDNPPVAASWHDSRPLTLSIPTLIVDTADGYRPSIDGVTAFTAGNLTPQRTLV